MGGLWTLFSGGPTCAVDYYHFAMRIEDETKKIGQVIGVRFVFALYVHTGMWFMGYRLCARARPISRGVSSLRELWADYL